MKIADYLNEEFLYEDERMMSTVCQLLPLSRMAEACSGKKNYERRTVLCFAN